MPRATVTRGPDLRAATFAAVGAIGDDGGAPTHIALAPSVYAAEAGREDTDGRPLYPDGLSSFAGLESVLVPGLATPLVYDATRLLFVVARDFKATVSRDYAPAFKKEEVAIKVTGRFGIGCPGLDKTVRALDLAPAA